MSPMKQQRHPDDRYQQHGFNGSTRLPVFGAGGSDFTEQADLWVADTGHDVICLVTEVEW